MSKTLRWILGLACLLALVAVRFFEEQLFFDPLYSFYHGTYLEVNEAPDFSLTRSALSISFRYWINTGFSLLLLYVSFQSKKVMRFSLGFYGFAFAALMIAFLITAHSMQPESFMTVFYIRRFLIQPLFILLLLPAFYYQENLK